MAVDGISRLIDNLATGLTQLGSATRQSRSPFQADSGGGNDQADYLSRPRQLINVDGVVLDRNAPRGTYVDITV